MTRMVVAYRVPEDPAGFDRHYFEVHIPLAKGLPGLLSYEVNEGPVSPMGGAGPTHRVAILTFASMADLRAAFASDVGRQCAADRRILAADDAVQMFVYDDRPV